jgi:hypothetical protein
MAATRGPVPKHSTQRRRRNDNGITEAKSGRTPKPLPLREGLHPLASRWYASLAESGQARFYEPSDWATALIIAEAVDLYARKPSGALLSSILAGSTVLLTTEGDRRRLRLELVREDEQSMDDDDRADATVSDLRARLSSA